MANQSRSIANDLTGLVVGGTVVILVGFFAAAIFSPQSNQGIKDAASAVALISATAVGIERILEVFWNFIDSTRGSFWPLTEIDKKISDLVDSITAPTTGPLAKLRDGVQAIEMRLEWTETQIEAAQSDIKAIGDQIDQLKNLAPTSDNAQAITAYATRALSAVGVRYPTIKTDAEAAAEAVGAISDFIASLSDNPGRRILSIYLGSLMGLVVAATIGLDAFAATLGTASSGLRYGVALTGVVMGLGSSPTHELIKALQTYKEHLKSS